MQHAAFAPKKRKKPINENINRSYDKWTTIFGQTKPKKSYNESDMVGKMFGF